MNKKTILVNYFEVDKSDFFSEEIQQLIAETKGFSGNAYAPYSNFRVSAGLLLENGTIVKGANVENAAYPASICAERTLLSHTISNYPNELIKVVAIYVDKIVGSPVPPCGICRQTLLETELKQAQDIQVILISKEGKFVVFERAKDLLPLYFEGSVL